MLPPRLRTYASLPPLGYWLCVCVHWPALPTSPLPAHVIPHTDLLIWNIVFIYFCLCVCVCLCGWRAHMRMLLPIALQNGFAIFAFSGTSRFFLAGSFVWSAKRKHDAANTTTNGTTAQRHVPATAAHIDRHQKSKTKQQSAGKRNDDGKCKHAANCKYSKCD